MRTLGLGMLALLSTTFALLSNGKPVAAEPTDKEKSEMAAKVYTLLKDKCASCHSADAKVVFGKKGTLNYILDYDKLISEKLIDTKSPEKSELYTEIGEGNMPRELDKDGKPKTKKKLAQAEIDLVLNWIKAGAPKWAERAETVLRWTCLSKEEDKYFGGSSTAIAQGPSKTLVCVNYSNVDERSTTYIWDGFRWQEGASPPSCISTYSGATFDPTKNVSVFLGKSVDSGRQVVCEWNGKEWTERNFENAPAARSAASLLYHPERKSVIMFGGFAPLEKNDKDYKEGTNTRKARNETWEYTSSGWTKLDLKNPPPTRNRYLMAYDEERRQLVLFQGHSLGTLNIVDPESDSPAPVWILEPEEWRKVQPTEALPKNQGYAAIWHPGLKCVVTCGWQRVSEKNHRDVMPVFGWNGETWQDLKVEWPQETWTIGNPALVWDAANDAIVLSGGEDLGNNLNGSVWALMSPDWKRK